MPVTEDLFNFQHVNLIVPWGIDFNWTFETSLGNISSWTAQFKVVDLDTNGTMLYLTSAGGAGTHGTVIPNASGQIQLSVDGANLRFAPRPYPFGLKIANGSNDKAIATGQFVLREFPS